MRGMWKRIKQLIQKIKELVKIVLSNEDEFEEVRENIKREEEEKEYDEEIIKNFQEKKGKGGSVYFSQQQVRKFNKERSVKNAQALEEEEQKRDDILSSLLSGFPGAVRSISDTIWEVAGNLPKTVVEAFRVNLYKVLKEQGETQIIKPSINPEKFYYKYSGEGKNYLDLFSEKERGFLTLSLFVDEVDISKRAEALIWYYDRENDLEWGNIYLSRLNCCDPRRRVDVRSAYIDLFTEIWDDEEEKMTKKSVFELAKASDTFFNECYFRMKMERLAGIEWFKESYGWEYIYN